MALLKRLGITAVSLTALGLALVCVLSWIPAWPCSLLVHFRVQYVECGLVLAAAAGALDHVLTSCTIGVRDRRIGRDVGSDHLPVIVDLVIPR